jgi:hypothetical protein
MYLLALYMLLLPGVPCSDAHNICSEKTSSTTTTTNHDHEQDHDDNCSPFCVCSCCGTSIAVFEFSTKICFTQNIFEYNVAEKVAIKNENVLASFSNAIWQPPKFIA